jgi:hypothetical protein
MIETKGEMVTWEFNAHWFFVLDMNWMHHSDRVWVDLLVSDQVSLHGHVSRVLAFECLIDGISAT